MLLASPGPVHVRVCWSTCSPTTQQKNWFYGRILEKPTVDLLRADRAGPRLGRERAEHPPDARTATLTAPSGTSATRPGRCSGVVFARTRPGPLGITAVLVDTSAPGYSAEPAGHDRPARRADQRDHPVRHGDPAGPGARAAPLPPPGAGMWGGVQTFNRLRPGVAAIALGIARAAHEYVLANRSGLTHGRTAPAGPAAAPDRRRPRADPPRRGHRGRRGRRRPPRLGRRRPRAAARRGGDARGLRLLRPRRPPGPSRCWTSSPATRAAWSSWRARETCRSSTSSRA